jgi:uncharacterized membrane protein
MFDFLFKYPIPVFSQGKFVLLGSWPVWALSLLLVLSAVGLGLMIWSRLPRAAPQISRWRAGTLWLLQFLLIATVLILLWQPAMTVAELASRQNVIAVVLDDSRSMAIADSGPGGNQSRELAAKKALTGGVLEGLQKRFQTRIYRLDTSVAQVPGLDAIQPSAAATHLNDSLRQFTSLTSGLPIGAIVLLSDGAENSADGSSPLARETLQALRSRRLPVHTIGFGKERLAHDVELENVQIPSRAMAGSRVPATVTFQQTGYAGRPAVLVVRDGDKVLGTREVTLNPDRQTQVETVFFAPGDAGVKNLRFSLGPLAEEDNTANNLITRLMNVSADKRRILYVEGEPRWEYKFLRRAEDEDPTVQVASMLRTTENKIYRQGISDPSELENGFPVRPEDLFRYQGIVLGSVEAGYLNPLQRELLREFVDRRGGGLLFLGGRFSLADGGWGVSDVADLLPTVLPNGRTTFHRDPATAELTPAGADSPITRLLDDPAKNAERWKKLTYMMDYQEAGTPKPGASTLLQMNAAGRRLPLLVTENYGRGRTALLATSGTWRWQMSQPLGDPVHNLFWQQLLRWLVEETPGPATLSATSQTLMDTGQIDLTASVRDNEYIPAPDSKVTAHITGPDGLSVSVNMAPAADQPGVFHAAWTAEKPGSYMAEVSAQRTDGKGVTSLGSDALPFQRIDGVAENFRSTQNRELLERLASETGGRSWKIDQLNRLPDEISYSNAGISVRDTKSLWDMPIVFLWLLLLLASQWLLRRKWGVV